ncbi:hypothetical protein AK812_SmicGene1823 [Symbiodinium microadriaticum]|uniref:Uncharacterized protein n=1 Tax=Symbiodinium microadriaticum TaxID=2951 RepID=A0A1Q9F348_SYMMI|nr:hypothetical protein AK812_SmicGene1823 [Symbiodinium microadriaticum]
MSVCGKEPGHCSLWLCADAPVLENIRLRAAHYGGAGCVGTVIFGGGALLGATALDGTGMRRDIVSHRRTAC